MSVSFKKNGIIAANGYNIGENILMGTHRKEYSTTANTVHDRDLGLLSGGSGGNGKFSIIEEDVPVGVYSYNITNNTSGNRDFQQGGIPFEVGQKYTCSFWAKGSGTCLYRSWNRTTGKAVFSKTWTLTSDWEYYTHTFTATQAQQDNDCTFHLGVSGSSSIKICGMKLEKGEIATPWNLNSNDWGFVGDKHGIIETGNHMSIYSNHIQTTEFIEY